MMRRYHRWISFPLILFVLLVTGTGLYLQVVELLGATNEASARPSPKRTLPRREALLSDIARSLDAAEQARPGFPAQKAEIIYSPKGAELKLTTNQRIGPSLSVNIANGAVTYVARPKRTLRTVFVLLHSGKLYGIPGLLAILLAGWVLLVLAATGIVLYLQMYIRRRGLGRSDLFWK